MHIINFYGGPKTGKTSLSYELLAALKARDKMVGFALEYATSLITKGLAHMLKDNQAFVMINQHRLLYDFRNLNVFDYVVTDSPVLMQQAYFDPSSQNIDEETFKKLCLQLHNDKGFENIEILCLRNDSEPYQEKGRVHSEMEARALDRKILHLLEENVPEFLVFDPAQESSSAFISRLLDEIAPETSDTEENSFTPAN